MRFALQAAVDGGDFFGRYSFTKWLVGRHFEGVVGLGEYGIFPQVSLFRFQKLFL